MVRGSRVARNTPSGTPRVNHDKPNPIELDLVLDLPRAPSMDQAKQSTISPKPSAVLDLHLVPSSLPPTSPSPPTKPTQAKRPAPASPKPRPH
ncbi:hypothetical protein DFH28DRAFT_1119205 [Melampsora americana]|nr:hypothetical protein DFH28DRAFT_1119205 [Melampsora americana]